MASRYCLDANVYIQAKNGPYGMDIVPSFWEFLDEQADAGAICSSKVVYEELAAGGDALANWVKARKDGGMFVEPDEKIQAVFGDIADYVLDKYANHQARPFLNGADPWIIAQAKVEGAVVVTHERLVKNESVKVKIPNICVQFGVKYVHTYEMLRALGAHF
jgi:predicted nucleic acid-binding protein